MFKYLFTKTLAIGGVGFLLLIALLTVDHLVDERKTFRQQAVDSIVNGAASAQRLAGPVWVLPYRVKRLGPVDEKTGRNTVTETAEEMHVLPDKLVVGGDLRSEVRKRGIYQALLYHANLKVSGLITLPAAPQLPQGSELIWGKPYLAVAIQDTRGIHTIPAVVWGGESRPFAPGVQVEALRTGIHADLPDYDGKSMQVPFSFQLSLGGMDQFDILPLGRETDVALQSDWRNPSFVGHFLPDRREVRADGFNANWHSNWFANNVNDAFEHCAPANCQALNDTALSVRLIDPVDVYAQTDRAVKYGFLFISLTFMALFLTEVLRRRAIHPVQYGLVGVSLAIFFLLLLSLAEQVPFGLAYAVAALACVAQNTFYARHALGGLKPALLHGALLSGLYLLLCLEDYALMCGALMLFVLLTATMVLTRKLDWYALGREPIVEASGG